MNARDAVERAEELRRTGAEAEALSAFEEAARLAAETFAPEVEARAMLGAGELFALKDDLAAARRALEEAIARAVEGGVPLVEAQAWLSLAHAFFDEGFSKDGHDAVLEAMALYRGLEGPEAQAGLARSVRLYGEHIGVLGDSAEARHALELARIMFVELGDEDAARSIEEDMTRLSEWSR